MWSLTQVWPLTPGIWTITHRCFRGLKETPLVWSVLTWPSPTGGFVLNDQISRMALCCMCVAWLCSFCSWVFLFSDIFFAPWCPSEHSRHWFFRGRMVIDRQEQKETLFSLIMDTQQHSNQNNVIKFCDNSR